MDHEHDIPLSSCASSPPCGRTKNWVMAILHAIGDMFSNCGNFCGENEACSSQNDDDDGGVDVDPPAAARRVHFDEAAYQVRFIPTKEEELDFDVWQEMTRDKWVEIMLQGRRKSF